jgi:hypothetical protein
LVGLATTSRIHPSSAALLPRVARSTEDLVSSMLWVTYRDSASPLIIATVMTTSLSVLLATTTSAPVVYAALPSVGVCVGVMEALSRTLLQRSSDPRHLGSLVAALGFTAGIGQLIGAVLAQICVAIGGLRTALAVLATTVPVLAGEPIMIEGEPGEACFVIAETESSTSRGRHGLRRAERWSCGSELRARAIPKGHLRPCA